MIISIHRVQLKYFYPPFLPSSKLAATNQLITNLDNSYSAFHNVSTTRVSTNGKTAILHFNPAYYWLITKTLVSLARVPVTPCKKRVTFWVALIFIMHRGEGLCDWDTYTKHEREMQRQEAQACLFRNWHLFRSGPRKKQPPTYRPRGETNTRSAIHIKKRQPSGSFARWLSFYRFKVELTRT